MKERVFFIQNQSQICISNSSKIAACQSLELQSFSLSKWQLVTVNFFSTMPLTRPDTQLPKSRAGGQGRDKKANQALGQEQ